MTSDTILARIRTCEIIFGTNFDAIYLGACAVFEIPRMSLRREEIRSDDSSIQKIKRNRDHLEELADTNLPASIWAEELLRILDEG